MSNSEPEQYMKQKYFVNEYWIVPFLFGDFPYETGECDRLRIMVFFE